MLTKEEFKREFVRMLDSVRNKKSEYRGAYRCADIDCNKCPINYACKFADIFNRDDYKEAVEKWSKEHPIEADREVEE